MNTNRLRNCQIHHYTEIFNTNPLNYTYMLNIQKDI